jgi:hypothetical protein
LRGQALARVGVIDEAANDAVARFSRIDQMNFGSNDFGVIGPKAEGGLTRATRHR